MAGWALSGRLATRAVTQELSVQYRRPVPLDRRLHVEARGEPLKQDDRWRMHGRLVIASSGAELGTASRIWVQRDESHYLRHQQWLRDQDRYEG